MRSAIAVPERRAATLLSALRRHQWEAIGSVLGVGLLVAEAIHFEWKLDDAYITFVYAQNWVQGHGIVFNIGERVEGYTCFLWVALSALGLGLGVDIVRWSTALGVLSGIGTVLAAWQLARELAPERLRRGAVCTALAVGGYPALAWWAASGMETVLFTFLVTTAIWRHVRDGADSILAPVCLGLASMTRPEGCLLSALLCLDAVRLGSWRLAGRYIGIFVAVFAPYYAWRFWYYGYPVPNTFYAKVGHTEDQVRRGVGYVWGFLARGAGAPLVMVAAAAPWAIGWRRLLSVYVFVVTYIVYVILVGGDVFLFYRFLVPIVPVLIALSVAAVLTSLDRMASVSRMTACAACTAITVGFLACCTPLFAAQTKDVVPQRNIERLVEMTCGYLLEHTEPTDEIAAGGIGLLKFCTGRRVIDILGLADKHIAHQQIGTMGKGLPGHEKYDSAYVLARWPKYITIPRPDVGVPGMVRAVIEMWADPLFKRYYAPDQRGGYRRIDTIPKSTGGHEG